MQTTSLLIIGNGFDLSCKLKSSYADFFTNKYDSMNMIAFNNEFTRFIAINSYLNSTNDIQKNEKKRSAYYRQINHITGANIASSISKELDKKKEIEESNKLRDECINNIYNNKNLTFWDYVFLMKAEESSNKELLWKDVESEVRKVLEAINERDIQDFNDFTKELLLGYINSDKFNNSTGDFITENEFIKESKYENMYDFLMSELNEFEKSFKDYLSEEVENNKAYKDKANELYFNIIGILEKYIVTDNYVLSFNYTNPFFNRLKSNYRTVNKTKKLYVNNVHGNLESDEIIFGIDDFDNVTEEMNIFTKTNRIMGLKDREIKSIPNEKYIKNIFFFGHSFSEADYSYFLSIFDYYEIYNSNVRLNFVYANHCDSAKKNQLKSINKLMNKYGESFDNKAKGKNLMHKLNLEGRIRIKEIKV